MTEAMTESPQTHFTLAEYFLLEEEATERHEYRNGEIVAMAGGTEFHSLISLNFGGELRNSLKGTPCRAYESNLRVKIQGMPLYTYPDIFAICGATEYDPKDRRHATVTNPKLVVEVVSKSTEIYDRVEKFKRYLRCDSLHEYVLISQDAPRVESYLRREDGSWLFRIFAGLEAVANLESVGVSIPLSEIYANVTFPPEPEMPTEPTDITDPPGAEAE